MAHPGRGEPVQGSQRNITSGVMTGGWLKADSFLGHCATLLDGTRWLDRGRWLDRS